MSSIRQAQRRSRKWNNLSGGEKGRRPFSAMESVVHRDLHLVARLCEILSDLILKRFVSCSSTTITPLSSSRLVSMLWSKNGIRLSSKLWSAFISGAATRHLSDYRVKFLAHHRLSRFEHSDLFPLQAQIKQWKLVNDAQYCRTYCRWIRQHWKSWQMLGSTFKVCSFSVVWLFFVTFCTD